MKIDIITLFPKMFAGPFAESIIKRAQEKGLVEMKIHNLRDWAVDERGTVDDRPFGVGPGMVLKPEPIFAAVEDIKRQKLETRSSKLEEKLEAGSSSKSSLKPQVSFPASSIQHPASTIILLTPQGKPFDQKTAQRLSKQENLLLICGHYEGVDERIREHLVDEEISIGDYVLTGGELPAMVVTDAIVRLIPGVLEKPESTESESFSTLNPKPSTLEYPQYTRPENFRGHKVPKILLSGNHQKIDDWRGEQAEKRTKERRPDLFAQ